VFLGDTEDVDAHAERWKLITKLVQTTLKRGTWCGFPRVKPSRCR